MLPGSTAMKQTKGTTRWALVVLLLVGCSDVSGDTAREMMDPSTERSSAGSDATSKQTDDAGEVSSGALMPDSTVLGQAGSSSVDSASTSEQDGVITTSVLVEYVPGTPSSSTPCRVWLDEAPSDMLPADVVVMFYANGMARTEGDGLPVPFKEAESCTAMPEANTTKEDAGAPNLPLDAGAASPADASASNTPANPSAMSGEGPATVVPDAGVGAPSTTPSETPAAVDADRRWEGWHLVEEPETLWLELCPAACFDIQTLGGLLELEVNIGVRPAGAR